MNDSTRWGEYKFCDGCKYQTDITVCGNPRHRCCFPISGRRFPKQCDIPEWREIELMRGAGYREHGRDIEENGECL